MERLERTSLTAVVIFLCIGILVLAGCSQEGLQQEGRKTESERAVVIRAGYLPIIPALPLLMAEEKGLFEQQGVDVRLVKFTTSNDAMNALIGEQIDLYFLASSSVTLQLEERRPGFTRSLMVNANTKANPLDYILVLDDSSIEALVDLVDKKVGVFPGSTMQGFLRGAMREEGLEAESMELIELPPPNQISSLLTGEIDALLALEPIPTQAVKSGKVRVLVSGMVERYLIDPWLGGTATVRASFMQEHSQTLVKFLRAIETALEDLQAPSQDNLEVLAKYTAIPPDLAREVGFVQWLLPADVPRENFQELAHILRRVGVLEKPVSTSEMFVPADFLASAPEASN